MESGFQENTIAFLMIIGILIMLALALAFVLFVNSSQKKILKERMSRQKQAYQHQEELLHSTILTQEEERKRIARELHDEIGSKLNVIFLNIQRLMIFSEGHQEMQTITQEVDGLINTTLETTRRISHDLLPPTLEDFGLVEAIKELRDTFLRTGNVHIEFELLGTEKTVEDRLIELNIFRVIQELINNSIRHGKANNIGLQLNLEKALLKMEYQDDGQGFDLTDLGNRKGLGMKNIESRLHMIHATFQWNATPGKGMSLSLELKQNK